VVRPPSNAPGRIYNLRNAPTAKLCWATMNLVSGTMQGGEGPTKQPTKGHVLLFAMHNLVSTTFRDSIRIHALLQYTSVTHISTMSHYWYSDCVGHNEVHYEKTKHIYPLLINDCPPTVIWDWNFVPGGYVVDAYQINLFAGQVPGFFACGAHMVIMPNWVLREPSQSCLDKNITRNGYQSTVLIDGKHVEYPVSFEEGLAEIAPGVQVKQITLSALEAETHHPLVTATIKADAMLNSSKDPNAAGASWSVNKRYIGEKEAFFVFYNPLKIPCPYTYLLALRNNSS
jgi:hypothetical protein